MADPKERRADYILIGGMASDIKAIKENQEKHDERTERIEKKTNKHGEDLAALKGTAARWGFVSGALSTIALYLKMSWESIKHGGQ